VWNLLHSAADSGYLTERRPQEEPSDDLWRPLATYTEENLHIHAMPAVPVGEKGGMLCLLSLLCPPTGPSQHLAVTSCKEEAEGGLRGGGKSWSVP